MKNFRAKVRKFYKPYYDKGDKTHTIEHADDVCDLALRINKEYDEKLVILASYIHDMFNATNRAIHNELAYEYVLKTEDNFLKELSKKGCLEVAHAVLEHRGCFTGEFYSPLSAIISSADRGLPDLDVIVIRSMRFNHENGEDVQRYVVGRYGTKGYVNYPDVYREMFKEELEVFRKLADELTVERVWEIYTSAEANPTASNH